MKQVNCKKCQTDFQITQPDLDFYQRLQVPPPTWCFECRLQRRMMFRNDRNLRKRPCSQCGQSTISMYAAEAPFIVWCNSCWIADTQEAEDFAIEYDFSQPFFEQFKQLFQRVPRQHLYQKNNVNSPWANGETNSKNCYMTSGGSGNEDGAYNTWSGFTSNCFDNYSILKSQLCYESNMVNDGYKIFSSIFVFNSRDVYFSENCTNSSNLIGCINLKNKSYQIFNQPVTPQEFTQELDRLLRYAYQQEFKQRFAEFRLKNIHPHAHGRNSENCSGDFLDHSQNCGSCYTTFEAQSCAYSFGIGYIKDSYDIFSGSLGMELCYEYSGAGDKCYKAAFSRLCAESHDIFYSSDLTNCSNCFGCVGLKNKQFCILNKQYTEQEYKALLPKIKAHMDQQPYQDQGGRTYRFGEFFPAELSPFAYNESIVQDFYPLTDGQAQAQGFPWRAKSTKGFVPTVLAADLPDSITDVDSSILKQVIRCAHQVCTDNCTEVFTIVASELEFLKKQGVPLPRLCPTCRHVARIKQKNPMRLWERSCQCNVTCSVKGVYTNLGPHDHQAQACPRTFTSTYSPERPEVVYCKECYSAETV